MSKIEISADTLHRSLAGETILINLATGLCFRLDETGNRIWELIVEHGERDKVADELMAEFDAEPERIASDVDAFLGELAERDLIALD